jgi:hypothetical protein
MTKNTELVYKGFLRLSEDEKNMLIQELNRYLKKDYNARVKMANQERISLGPLSTACVCCGK